MKNITTTYTTHVKQLAQANSNPYMELGFGGRRFQALAFDEFINKYCTLYIAPTASGKSTVQVICAAKQILDSNYTIKQLFVAPQLDIGNNFSEYKIKNIKVDGKVYEWEITHNFCKNNKMSVKNLKKFLLSTPDCSSYKKKNKIGGVTAVCTSAAFSAAWKSLTAKQKLNSIINLSIRIDEAHHVMGVSKKSEQNCLGDIVKFFLDNNGRVHLTTATFFRADNQPIIDVEYLPKFNKYTVPFLEHWDCLGLVSLTQEYRTYVDAEDLKQQILQDIRDNPDQKPMIIVPATGIGYFKDKKLKKKWVKALVVELEELFGNGKVLDLVSSDTQKAHKKRITNEVQDFHCVVTCAIGREGTDWMACNKVHNSTVDNSVGLAIQKLGRPMRSYKGKTSITMVNYFPEMPNWDGDREEIRAALSDRYNAVIVASMMNDNFCPIAMPAKIKKKYEALETNKKSSYTLEDVYGPASIPMLDDLYKSVDALPVEKQTNENIDEIITKIIDDNKDVAIYDAADEDVRECLKKQLIRSKNASIPKLKLEPVDVSYVREAGWDKVIEETVKGKSFFTATTGKDEMTELQKFLQANNVQITKTEFEHCLEKKYNPTQASKHLKCFVSTLQRQAHNMYGSDYSTLSGYEKPRTKLTKEMLLKNIENKDSIVEAAKLHNVDPKTINYNCKKYLKKTYTEASGINKSKNPLLRRNMSKRNSTGYTGVGFDKSRKKYTARLSTVNGVLGKSIGRFDTIQEAHLAREKALNELPFEVKTDM